MSKFIYQTIHLRTPADFTKAERLVALGWRVITNGVFSILLEKSQ